MFNELRSRKIKRWKVLSDSQWRKYSWEWILAISRLRWKRIVSISERKTCWCAQSVVQCCRDRVQRTTTFLFGTWRRLHDSDSQQNRSGIENPFWEIGEVVWKKRTYSCIFGKQHFQLLLEQRGEIHRNQQSCEELSAVGKRAWQSRALVNPTETLNRDVAPIGSDIEPVEVPCEDAKNGNWRIWRIIGGRDSQSQNKPEESHESTKTRTRRFGTCCFQKLVCRLCQR